MRFDLHVHGERSSDAKGSLLDLALAAKDAGLDGFAITEHNALTPRDEIQDVMADTGQLILSGIEVSTLQGHVLALGVEAPVPKRRSLKATVKAIDDQGGLAVPSHPLKVLSGMGPHALRGYAEDGTLVAAEARNGRERALVQANSEALVRELGLAMTGGTDVHWVRDIGTTWTQIDQEATDEQGVLSAIRAGACSAQGGRLSRARVVGHGLTVPWRTLREKRK